MEGYDRRYTFWEGYRNAMTHLDDARELKLRRAIDSYAFEGEAPVLDEPILALAWELILPSLDKSVKLSKAGRKGGRGHKKEALKPDESLEKATENRLSGGFKGVSKGFREAFNEEEVEEEVEEEKEREMARSERLLSFYSTTQPARSVQ